MLYIFDNPVTIHVDRRDSSNEQHMDIKHRKKACVRAVDYLTGLVWHRFKHNHRNNVEEG